MTTSSLTITVIGHVNHGKTALVRAVTGIETDRLKDSRNAAAPSPWALPGATMVPAASI